VQVFRAGAAQAKVKDHQPKIKTNGVLFTFFLGSIARDSIGFDLRRAAGRLVGVPL
jgi:hypothetical protein